MTESTSPMDDTQTFDIPATDMLPQQLQVGTCDLVPQQDGSGAILTYTIDGACQFFVAIPEDAVRNFTNLRRVMAGRRITLAKPSDMNRWTKHHIR